MKHISHKTHESHFVSSHEIGLLQIPTNGCLHVNSNTGKPPRTKNDTLLFAVKRLMNTEETMSAKTSAKEKKMKTSTTHP